MNLKLAIGATVVAVMAVSAWPAGAQGREWNRRDRPRDGQSGAREPRGDAVRRPSGEDRRTAPRVQNEGRRSESWVDRGYSRDRGRQFDRQRDWNRQGDSGNWRGRSENRYYADRGYAERYRPVRPWIARPYDYRSWRPGLSIGVFFGSPYAYRGSYNSRYGYPIAIAPGAAYGGLTFGYVPDQAQVFVDGTYVGLAGDFNGTRQALTLPAGMHRIELDAPDFQPMGFDVDILPGRITPCQVGMQRAW